MFRETACAPEQLRRLPANSRDCDLCRELSFELKANVATAIPAETRLPGPERAGALPLAIWCSQGLSENRWVRRRDALGVGRSDGARAAPELKYARHPMKNPR